MRLIQSHSAHTRLYTFSKLKGLSTERHVRMIKYWFKLVDVSNRNCLLNAVYNSMLSDMTKSASTKTQWLAKVKDLLDHTGFSEIWNSPKSVRMETFIPMFKMRLIDNFIVYLRTGLESNYSMTLYREINSTFELQSYLLKIHNSKRRQALSKLRLLSHGLLIETGRHIGIERQNRKCAFCNTNDIEDEYHFVLICPLYNDIRSNYILKILCKSP